MTLNTAPLTSISGASAPGTAAAPAAGGPEAEQRFLKLLVTQLNNQDPLNPLDNAQLTSQLAQMSTVSGIEKLNNAFASLVSQSTASQVLQSASLIGRSVMVPSQAVQLTPGAAVPFSLELAQSAGAVQVNVTDANGQLVRSFDAGALPAGPNALTWDGLGNAQAALPAGVYTLSAAALGGDGAATAATVLTFARVTSVAQTAAGVSLDLAGGGRASLADVRQIQ